MHTKLFTVIASADSCMKLAEGMEASCQGLPKITMRMSSQSCNPWFAASHRIYTVFLQINAARCEIQN